MIQRDSIFFRGRGRVRDSLRTAHSRQVRAGDNVGLLTRTAREGLPLNLAPDIFTVSGTITADSTCGILGSGYGTEFRCTASSGPILDITADKVVVDGIRFVYRAGLVSTESLITRADRSGGYSPAALATDTELCAIRIKGSNCAIRNCWFEGFDNAILIESTGTYATVENCYFSGRATSRLSSIYVGGNYTTIDKCYSTLSAYGVYVNASNCSVKNSILHGVETGLFSATALRCRYTGNDCQGSTSGADPWALVISDDTDYLTMAGNVVESGHEGYVEQNSSQFASNIGTYVVVA